MHAYTVFQGGFVFSRLSIQMMNDDCRKDEMVINCLRLLSKCSVSVLVQLGADYLSFLLTPSDVTTQTVGDSISHSQCSEMG